MKISIFGLLCFVFISSIHAQTPLEFARQLVPEDSLEWVKEVSLDSAGYEHWYLGYGWGLYYRQEYAQMKKLGAAMVARAIPAFEAAGPEDEWIKKHYYTGLTTYWQFHTMEGYYREGTQAWERVLAEAERELGTMIELSYGYVGLGIAYQKFGDPYRALWAQQQGTRVVEANTSPGADNYYLLGNKYNNLAVAYRNLLQPRRAIELYNKAARIYEIAGSRKRWLKKLDIAATYLELNDWVSAERIVDSILQQPEIWADEPRLEVYPLYQKAQVLEAKGENERALTFYRAAEIADKKPAYEYGYFGQTYEGAYSFIKLRFARLQRAENNLVVALEIINRAIDRWLRFTDDPNSSYLVDLQLEKLEILREQGEFGQGLELADQLLAALSNGEVGGWRQDQNGSTPDDEQLSADLILALTGRAALLYDALERGYPRVTSDQVLRDCELAKQMIRSIRTSYAPDFYFGSLIEENERIYDIAAKLYLSAEQGTSKPEQYFLALEDAKEIRLSATFNVQGNNDLDSEISKLMQREARLRKDFRLHDRLLDAELAKTSFNEPLIERLRTELKDIKVAQDSVRIALGKLKVADVFSGDTDEPTSLKSIQPRIKAGELLCTYRWGGRQLFGLCFSQDTAITFSLDNRGLQYRIEAFQQSLNNPTQQAVPDEDWQQLAHGLYNDLLGKHLGQALLANTNQLILIPDGPLHLLSWSALLTEPPTDTESWRDLPYLMRSCALVADASVEQYFYSLPTQTSSRFTSNYLGFAPVYRGEEVRQRGTTAERSQRQSIFPGYAERLNGELRFNQREVSEAGDFFSDASVFLAARATEGAFKKTVEWPRVVHLAAHGFTNDRDPSRSHVVFSAPEKGEMEDGLLFAYEIYGMSIPAELAVLSACETGDGQLRTGAGVMSLARAFKFAGCRDVLMSRWTVNDLTTYRLMANFMEKIKDGQSTAQALNAARIDHLDQVEKEASTHPYYWAGTALIGAGTPVTIGTPTSSSKWWWAMLLLSIFVFISYRLGK